MPLKILFVLKTIHSVRSKSHSTYKFLSLLYYFCHANSLRLTQLSFVFLLMTVPCGPGYYFDGEFCQSCMPGFYNPLPGMTECEMCPYDGGIIMPTLGHNAITVEDCEGEKL